MKITRSEAMKIMASVKKINDAAETVSLPFKINWAIQRSAARLEPVVKEIETTITATNKALNASRTAAQKEYADKTTDKDGKEIPLVVKGSYVITVRESELMAKLDEISKEFETAQKTTDAFLNEEVEVDLFQFEVGEDEKKKLDSLSGGMLLGLLPLISKVS